METIRCWCERPLKGGRIKWNQLNLDVESVQEIFIPFQLLNRHSREGWYDGNEMTRFQKVP